MSNAFNNCTLQGNLTRDPEVKQVGENKVAKFSIAYNRVWKKNGEKQEQVSYFEIEVWGNQATVVENYLKKGSQVAVMGELVQDRWEKDGENRSKVFVKASDLRLCGSKKDSGPSSDEQDVPQAAGDSKPPF